MVMPMATAATTSCVSTFERTTCWSNVNPTSTFASMSNLKVPMFSWCGYSASRLHNNIRWGMKGHRMQAKEFQKRRPLRALVEDAELISEDNQEQQTDVTVVTHSDKLAMFFKAEGTLADVLLTKVTQTLEDLEGVSNVKVDILEGIATVELTKETTAQATGVASELVEIIQGLDFKLQSLSLSFEDEEDE